MKKLWYNILWLLTPKHACGAKTFKRDNHGNFYCAHCGWNVLVLFSRKEMFK